MAESIEDNKDAPKKYLEALKEAELKGDKTLITSILDKLRTFGFGNAGISGLTPVDPDFNINTLSTLNIEEERQLLDNAAAKAEKEKAGKYEDGTALGIDGPASPATFAKNANIQFKNPVNAKRHILINAYSCYEAPNTGSSNPSGRYIEITTNDGWALDLDDVVSIVDNAVSGTLGAIISPITIVQPHYTYLWYKEFTDPAKMTNLTITWDSGATKTFDVLVPGFDNAMHEFPNGTNINDPTLNGSFVPGATGCSTAYIGQMVQWPTPNTSAIQKDELYFSIKKHTHDPDNLYTQVAGYNWITQPLDIQATATNQFNTYMHNVLLYHTGFQTGHYADLFFGPANALNQAHLNFGITGYDWNAIYGTDCTNQNGVGAGWPIHENFGVSPLTALEQQSETISLIAPKYAVNEIVTLYDWNQFAIDATAQGLTYNECQNSLLTGSTGPVYVMTATNPAASGPLAMFDRGAPVMTTIEWAINLDCCLSTPPTYYFVCDDPISSEYYLNQSSTNYGFDCYGGVIPTAALNGSTPNVVFLPSPISGCCSVDCSSNHFSANVFAINSAASFGVADGSITTYINEDPSNLGFGYGTPWTSGSQYLFTITHPVLSMTQTAPGAGGSTFTIASITTVSGSPNVNIDNANISDRITTGMQVTGTGVPSGTFVGDILVGQIGSDSTAGVDQFQLVDMNGAQVNATASGTVTFTFSSGLSHTWGSLASHAQPYEVVMTDSVGCTWKWAIHVPQSPPTDGCTDSNALNYDSTANNDDGTCLACSSSTGNAEGITNNSISIDFLVGTSYTYNVVTNYAGSNNNGDITFTAGINPLLITYLVTGTSTYTLTLYSYPTYADSLTPSTGGTQVAQQTGITLATGPTHTFTGLAAGYYACKIEIEDSNTGADAGLEICYGYITGIIQAEVCDDPTATNQNVTIDPMLAVANPSLCTYSCNTRGILTGMPSPGNPCFWQLDLLVIATQGIPAFNALYPDGTTLAIVWEFNGAVIAGATEITNGYVNSINYTTGLGPAYITQDGLYSVTITTTHPAGNSCVDTQDIMITLPVCGCTDPLANNYNPLATIDDGSCILPSWDCINWNCVDPLTGLGQYSNYNTCINMCVAPILGCTDPLAANYNPAAVQDDGSCEYEACLDQTAINNTYQYDCNGVFRPNATIPNSSCCQYCYHSLPTINNEWTTDATPASGCTTFADGQFSINASLNAMTSAHACPFWDLLIQDVSGTMVYAESGIMSSTTANTGAILAAGVYTYTVTDTCTGCLVTGTFFITGDDPTYGCMDPNSSNYTPLATCDDGSCIFCGCTDSLALNYTPGASCDDGSCVYVRAGNPCMLDIEVSKRVLNKITLCLTKRGESYLNKMKTGLIDDCSIMNAWKVILIKYLLESQGKQLDCLYNCANADAPPIPQNTTSCHDIWVAGGPVTGVNDQAHAGSSITTGEGTTVTDTSLFFVAGNTLYVGDVIKMPSGNIWQVVPPVVNCTWGCYNPELPQGATSRHWKLCQSTEFFPPSTSTTVNYLDNFINFVNKFCADCNTNF